MKEERKIIKIWRVFILPVLLLSYQAKGDVEFAGGTGGPNNPYQIASAEQLISIGSDPNLLDKCFVLINDIDLDPNLPGGQVFTQAVIAPDVNEVSLLYPGGFDGVAFTGRFDGNGHRIFNLSIYGNGSFLGLFSRIGNGGRIHDLRVVDASIIISSGSRYIGLLAGYTELCTITNCATSGSITAMNNSKSIGGLVGFVWFGSYIYQCSTLCDIYGGDNNESLGGLLGNNGGTITNCYASGSVSGGTGCNHLGGLVGFNKSPISRSGSTASSLGRIINCYAVGNVYSGDASYYIGGLVGKDDGYYTIHSFWDVQASGLSTSATGTGLTTAEMQDPNTFMAAEWDLAGERTNGTVDLWLVPEDGGYPILTVLSDTFQSHKLDGEGTIDNPYRIATAEDIGAIRHYGWLDYYELTDNIDLSGITWTIAPICCFGGHFDGAGFTVSNLTIRGRMYLGLFDIIDKYAEVQNIRIIDANIIGEKSSVFIGCLAGCNYGNILDCFASGNIKGSDVIGGLVGSNYKSGSIIYNCCATACIFADGSGIGGLAEGNGGNISHCYSICDLTGCFDVGGLVGRNGGNISNCFTKGKATGG
jgi:hypothetical protein